MSNIPPEWGPGYPRTPAEVQAAEAANQEVRRATERAISALLARLEGLTGCYVDGMHIHNDDITTIVDMAPRYARRVAIDLRRAPGSRWDK